MHSLIDELTYRIIPAAAWLAILWIGESYAGMSYQNRLRHASTNLTLAALNGLLLFSTIGLASVSICRSFDNLPFQLSHAIISILLLDLYSYLWHRVSHLMPFLWRFHSIHHSDAEMDATTSARFHIVELAIAGLVRLPLLYTAGVTTSVLLTYETVLVVVSMFHHSSLRLGWLDQLLRLAIVTPSVHSIHHSNNPVHFGRNYSSILNIWDRLFRTWMLTSEQVKHGLTDYPEQNARSVKDLVMLPFRQMIEVSPQDNTAVFTQTPALHPAPVSHTPDQSPAR